MITGVLICPIYDMQLSQFRQGIQAPLTVPCRILPPFWHIPFHMDDRELGGSALESGRLS